MGDLHGKTEITAELLNERGRATELVRYADIVSFTCLKAFAYDQRSEPKDHTIWSTASSIMTAA